jgi:hypothetical protein
MQSKVMLRIEEPNSDFVRLLVRTVALPQTPAALSAGCADSDSQNAGQQESAETAADSTQHSQEEQPRKVAPSPALSPAAVESLLSQSAGCEVMLQEESRWLVVSDTFSPGDICRWGLHCSNSPITTLYWRNLFWNLGVALTSGTAHSHCTWICPILSVRQLK